MRCHQGKHCPTALLKLCSMIPYFCILNPLISAQSFFLSSVSHITVFLPSFLSSSSQSLCEGSSDLGGIREEKGRLGWESICQRTPKGTPEKEQSTSPRSFQLPTIAGRFLLCPLPIPSQPVLLMAVVSGSLLCHLRQNYSIQKPSPLLSIAMQSLTNNFSYW